MLQKCFKRHAKATVLRLQTLFQRGVDIVVLWGIHSRLYSSARLLLDVIDLLVESRHLFHQLLTVSYRSSRAFHTRPGSAFLVPPDSSSCPYGKDTHPVAACGPGVNLPLRPQGARLHAHNAWRRRF